MVSFEQLSLSSKAIQAVKEKGFLVPTPIQRLTIPLFLARKKDIIAQAITGSGKTAAFGLPLLDLLSPEKHVQAIVLAPTRELAVQIAQELDSLKGDRNVKIVPIYGGQPIQAQQTLLRRGVHIVVGTPGRIIDHMYQGSIDLSRVQFFILDEADEMLHMGFIQDIEKIFEATPKDKRVCLFSATMPLAIKQLGERYMKDYEHLKVENSSSTKHIQQEYISIAGYDKNEVLHRILMEEKNFYGIIFCRTRKDVDTLSHILMKKGHQVDRLHGDISQSQREAILDKIKTKKLHMLVATDVAARGIDVKDLTHVINYSFPNSVETYVHRIGRTGRAGKKGKAITFIGRRDRHALQEIEEHTGLVLKKREIPHVDTIIKNQKQYVIEELSEVMNKEDLTHYRAWATQLGEQHSLEMVTAALLRRTFGHILNPKNYPDLPFSPEKRSSFRKNPFHKRRKTHSFSSRRKKGS